jgi:single-stranded-DNA-specific exonuclease
MEAKNVEAFCEKFEQVVKATILPEMLIPEILIDAEIKFGDIKPSFSTLFARWNLSDRKI